MSTGNQLIQEITDAHKTTDAQNAWHTNAKRLAEHAVQNLLNRNDGMGAYGSNGAYTHKLSQDISEARTEEIQRRLVSHFTGRTIGGIHANSAPDADGKWYARFGCIDLDLKQSHPYKAVRRQRNHEYALLVQQRLADHGIPSVVEDSNGRGAYHIWFRLSDRIEVARLFAFLQTLVADAEKHGFENQFQQVDADDNPLFLPNGKPAFASSLPETFPKQDTPTGDGFGNFIRLPGKHHTYDHWSRIWGDGEWLSIEDSVDAWLSLPAADVALIPELPPTPKPFETHQWRSDDAVVDRARKYVSRIPGAVSGGGGHNQTFHAACTVVKGFELSPDQALDVLSEWNTSCLPPWSEHELRHKIQSAVKAPGEVGYLRNAKPERWDTIQIPKYTAKVADSDQIVVRSFAGIDASELTSYASQEPDWLVQDVFTIDEPLLVGARSKGCKTLQLTDLAVAVASGTQWMNIFDVPKRRKVLFITGEANYRRIAKHIEKACRIRDIDFQDLKGYLRIEAVEFPCLPRIADQNTIRKDIETHGFEVVIADPLYRGLSGVDSARLGEMGDAIKSFQAACAPACMVLSHHVVKSAAREYGSPPQLEDMTGAGIAESCGQWWLVGRNEKYAWDWKHDLCIQFGGREGQGGGRRILFNEHDWTFQVDHWHEYTEQAQADEQQRRDDVRREADEQKRARARALILKAVRNVKTPQSKNAIRESCGAVQADFRCVFPEMVQDLTLVQRPYKDNQNRLQPVGYLLNEYVPEYDRSEMVVDVG